MQPIELRGVLLAALRGLLTAVLIVGVVGCATSATEWFEQQQPEAEAAAEPDLPAFEWAPDEERAAARLSSRLPSLVLNVAVAPHWIAGSEAFWYRRQHDFGVEFIRVDANEKVRVPAFDHVAMANALADTFEREFDPNKLPIRELVYSDPEATPAVRLAQGLYQCKLEILRCEQVAEAPAAIVAEDGALYWRAEDGAKELLAAAEGGAEWARLPDSAGDEILRRRAGLQLRPALLWSPQQDRVVTQLLDQQHVPLMPIVQASADDGSARPVLHQLHVPLPGEPAATAELYVFNAETGQRVQLQTGALEVPLGGPIARGHLWWGEQGNYLYWIQSAADGVRLHRFDAKTGTRRTLVNEAGTAASWPSRHHDGEPVVKVLGNGNVIWYSTASGFGHLYLYRAGGAAPITLTRGERDVHELVYVDEVAGVVFFTAGADAGDGSESAGVAQLYRVKLDGTDLRQLTTEPAAHAVSASPAGTYFVDSYSRPDWPSKSVIRDRFGREVMPLEQGHTDNLIADGFVMPEVFRLPQEAGAAITGTLYLPSNFDPAQRWAVIDILPPGSGTATATQGFYAERYESQALAEAGFIVVAIDRGAASIAAHIGALRQLAVERPWMDLQRVGVFGVAAGGADAARAVIEHGDFYRVGIAVSGSHDARLGAAVTGAGEGVDLGGLEQLRGRLLLAHGELDDRVHVSHTLRLVDALMRADKKFDMLIAPNVGHNLVELPWMQKRSWEYFWRYLGGPRRGSEPVRMAADQQAPAYDLETEILPSGSEDKEVPDTVDETIDKLNAAADETEKTGVMVITPEE